MLVGQAMEAKTTRVHSWSTMYSETLLRINSAEIGEREKKQSLQLLKIAELGETIQMMKL